MAEREQLEVGNNVVEAEVHDEFTDGYVNGSLYYYDMNHRLAHPLTTKSVYTFMAENLSDQRATPRWNAGFVFGWSAALCENDSAFFFASIAIPESAIVTESLPAITVQEA